MKRSDENNNPFSHSWYLLAFFSLLIISCDAQPKYELVWSDEFSTEGLPDSTKWSYDVGTACNQPPGCGWGNNELQYYTEKRQQNARIENGHLIIEAHNELYLENRSYTSARLVSKNKGDFEYGRVECFAKLPSGKGTWTAFWMLPTNWEYGGWPLSGEIDIMEYVGYEKDSIYGTVHTKAYNHGQKTHKGGASYFPDVNTNFHLYAIEWTPEKIDFFVDDNKYFTFENEGKTFEEWPFDKTFHLILNLAVGGTWGGKKGIDNSAFPQQFVVDYVRVYQKHNEKSH